MNISDRKADENLIASADYSSHQLKFTKYSIASKLDYYEVLNKIKESKNFRQVNNIYSKSNLKIRFVDFFSLICCCKKKIYLRKNYLYELAEQNFLSNIDILNYINKMNQLEFLKKILFSNSIQKIFEYSSKPIIYFSSKENMNLVNKMNSKNETENKQDLNYFDKISLLNSKGCDWGKIDEKLIIDNLETYQKYLLTENNGKSSQNTSFNLGKKCDDNLNSMKFSEESDILYDYNVDVLDFYARQSEFLYDL